GLPAPRAGTPMNPPPIKGFLETSFVDWPGAVASVLFLPGCNFRCPYCHNHRLALAPETLETWDRAGVLGRLAELRDWVDGVCVTGGEPTLHPGLGGLLAALKGLGFGVKLDTNGSRPGALGELLAAGLVDAVALDLKAPLEPIPYRRNAGPGADPAAVARSLELLAGSARWLELRTTVHPDLLSADELVRLARQAGRAVAGRAAPARFTPQRCRPEEALDPALRDRPGLGADAFEAWADPARRAFAEAAGRPGA
ncbi:MAG: anaerobic ribonucleoside-triphosphate reductase activating protein, partial [Deferrisomatales bacterium]